MDPREVRKRQIARRLGVSEQVLEQYLQLKNAEVLQSAGTTSTSQSEDASDPPSPRQRRSTPRVASWRTIRPDQD